MTSFRAISVIVLCVVLPLVIAERCNSCGDRCEKCEYGSTFSKTCEFEVCYKAPGEQCGHVDIADRLCAEGLYCKNGKCQGCSLSPFKCFTELLPMTQRP